MLYCVVPMPQKQQQSSFFILNASICVCICCHSAKHPKCGYKKIIIRAALDGL